MNCRLPNRIAAGGSSSVPSLLELFSDMTMVYGAGRNASSQSSLTYNASSITNPAYIFSICYGYVGVWKWTGSGVSATAIKRQDSSYGGLGYWSGNVAYYNGSSLSNTSTPVYGASLMFVQFPSYSADAVEQVLSGMTLTRIDGRNLSSQSEVYADFGYDDTHGLCICARGTLLDIRDGHTFNKLSGTSSDAFSVGSYGLTCNAYGASIIGVD